MHTYKDGILTIDWEMYKKAMRIIGAKGGRVCSEAKARSSRENAKKAQAALRLKRESGRAI